MVPERRIFERISNHAASGKATYSNCTFYGEKAWNGVTNIYSSEFAGTAEKYLPPDLASGRRVVLHCGYLKPMELPSALRKLLVATSRLYFILHVNRL